MKKTILILLVLFIALSIPCSAKTSERNTRFSKRWFHPLNSIINKNTTDIRKEFYGNGKIKSFETYNSSGELYGLCKKYHPNGQLKEIGYFLKDKKVAEWLYFNEDRELVKACFFNSKIQPEGWRYDQLMFANKCIMDEQNGLLNMYYSNNQLLSIGKYRKGYREGCWRYYYDNGTLKAKGRYHHWQKNGRWKEYYEDGSLKRSAKYNSGKSEGKTVAYYQNGQPQKRLKNRKGEVLKIKRFLENGEIDTVTPKFTSFKMIDVNGDSISDYTIGDTVYLSIEAEHIQDDIANLYFTVDEGEKAVFFFDYLGLYNSAIEDYPIKGDFTRIRLITADPVNYEPTDMDMDESKVKRNPYGRFHKESGKY